MKISARDYLLAGLLVVVGVVLRLQLQHIPNFAPVAGLALFSGFFFRSRWLALAVPLSIMGVSDFWVGGYELPLMLTVYGSLAAPVLLRRLLQRYMNVGEGTILQCLRSMTGVMSCGIAASVSFFVTTNLAVWLTTGFYERTLADLVTCFANALPFFRYTLFGDAIFTFVLFGGYAAITRTYKAFFAGRESENRPELGVASAA